MTTSTTRRTRRVTTRQVADGYRVSGQRKTYSSFSAAFQAAWRICLRTGADLYATTPDGRLVLQLTAEAIRQNQRTFSE